MEEATGAPSSVAVCYPKRLRASGRDGGAVMTWPPSPLTMLLSRHTKRRQFITLLGGAAAWPLAAHSQQTSRAARIGFLGVSTPSGVEARLQRLRAGLRDLGYIEGQSIFIDFRWAEGNYSRATSGATTIDATTIQACGLMVTGMRSPPRHREVGLRYSLS